MLVIPRRSKVPEVDPVKAFVSAVTDTHVQGWIYTYSYAAGFRQAVPKYFNVKLSNGKFSLGSGSGKMTFWLSDDCFNDQNKEP